jgi:hypothetical protein
MSIILGSQFLSMDDKTELSSSETGSSAEREIFQRKERLFERQMTVITDSLSKTRIHFEILIFI